MSQGNPEAVGYNWWDPNVDDSRRFVAAYTSVQALRALQSTRISSGFLYESTYEQQNVFGGDNTGNYFTSGLGIGFGGASGEVALQTFNAMQIGFDTLCSKLEQANGQVVFQTDGGNWEQQQKALQLKKLVSGEFYRLKFYEVKAMVALDMLLHGTGYIKFYCDPVTHKPSLERWHPLDVLFDEVEARDCPPLTMYTTRVVSKQVLKSLFPNLKMEIDSASISTTDTFLMNRGINQADAVELIECWRLPTGEGHGDGVHLLCINTATLEVSPWTRLDFPFARFDWCRRRRGPYSIPAAEQVIFLQRNLNRLVQREHECIYLLSAPYILADEAHNVDPAHFESNGVGNFIQFTATGAAPPAVVTNKVVPDDIRIAIQEVTQNIYAILGINGLESTGAKPTGLDTAPALASYMDQSSLRHIKTLKENERFTLRCAEQLLEIIRDIKDEYGEYEAFGQGTREVEKIKFSDADLPPDSYVIQMALQNLLPDSPAGRVQRVQELANTGAFQPKQIIKMLQSPDIDAATDDVTSTDKDIDWTIYQLTRPNADYVAPEESQDLALGVERVNSAYLSAKRQKAPDTVLEKLSMWRDTASSILQQQQQSQVQQQMQQQQQMMQMQIQMQGAQEQQKYGAQAQSKIEEMKAQTALDMQAALVGGTAPKKK